MYQYIINYLWRWIWRELPISLSYHRMFLWVAGFTLRGTFIFFLQLNYCIRQWFYTYSFLDRCMALWNMYGLMYTQLLIDMRLSEEGIYGFVRLRVVPNIFCSESGDIMLLNVFANYCFWEAPWNHVWSHKNQAFS